MYSGNYKSGNTLSENVSEVTDIPESSQNSLINNFYVHSRVRNFYSNKSFVNIDSLSKSIDEKIDKIFLSAIDKAKEEERKIYSSLQVKNAKELQENVFNLNNFQSKFNEYFSIYEVIQKIVDEYNGQDAKSITAAQLRKSLEKGFDEARNYFTENLYEINNKVVGKNGISGEEVLRTTVENDLQEILKSLKGNKRIDLTKLSKTPSHYIKSISKWQGDTGEIAQYCAGLKNDFIKKVEGELTEQLSGKKGKTDVKYTTTDDVELKLSVKNYKINDTQANLDIKIHDGKTLLEFAKAIGRIGNVNENVVNYFVYNMVNILAFSHSGAISDRAGTRVEKISANSFQEYQEFQNLIKKTAMYWLGIEPILGGAHEEESDYYGVHFLLINGTVIPMSEILEALRKNISKQTFLIKGGFSKVPQFGPTVLWKQKSEEIKKLDSMYQTGKRNYPSSLIKIGSTPGRMIAKEATFNASLMVGVDRLIRR